MHTAPHSSKIARSAYYKGVNSEGKYIALTIQDTSFGAAVWTSKDLIRFEGTASGVIRGSKFYLFGTEEIGQFVGDSIQISVANHSFVVGPSHS